VLVLYSDGIPDHLSPSGEEYGRRQLTNVVRANCHLSAQGVIDAIFADLDRVNRELFDDQTLVVLKVK
jgi:serine phosphatase RsbU (regulator of sigma subunit)